MKKKGQNWLVVHVDKESGVERIVSRHATYIQAKACADNKGASFIVYQKQM